MDIKLTFNLADGYDSHWLLNLENHMKHYAMQLNINILILFFNRKGPKFYELPPKL